MTSRFAIAIHAGAENKHPANPIIHDVAEIRAELERIVTSAQTSLAAGKHALDVVETAVSQLEDFPLVNAGRGSVLTAKQTVECDAAIMDGSTGMTGAVCSASHIRNPIMAARKVLANKKYALLSGAGADEFAKCNELEMVDNDYFITPARVEEFKQLQARKTSHFGTVGAVVRDLQGNLAAGTSTGGIQFKKFNRIGDSPIIGSGTFADKAVAVSCTGSGEYFIRLCVAHEISALVRYGKYTLKAALHEVIHGQLSAIGGAGGVIAVDLAGNIASDFNTDLLFRARANESTVAVEI